MCSKSRQKWKQKLNEAKSTKRMQEQIRGKQSTQCECVIVWEQRSRSRVNNLRTTFAFNFRRQWNCFFVYLFWCLEHFCALMPLSMLLLSVNSICICIRCMHIILCIRWSFCALRLFPSLACLLFISLLIDSSSYLQPWCSIIYSQTENIH